MFHFGFSYIGLIYLLMLFIPNILWAKNKPQGYEEYASKENRILLVFERVGEGLTCAIALIFSDFNIRGTLWVWVLAVSFAFMILNEVYWIRYFRSRKNMKDFYSSLLGIPVAGATLPVIALFLLGIYGCNASLIISVIILGIGHIGIHLSYRNDVCGKKKSMLPIQIIKWIFCVIGILLMVTVIFITGSRNINYIKHYELIRNGIDEGIYVPLGGQEQYVLIRGMNTNNPIIIYLHGGPSSPDTYTTYGFTDYLVGDYTVIAWDQRGCGRTYFHNQEVDPANETASFDQAQKDLDDLVDYAIERFGQEKVIILGHSYGTILGSVYVREHPEKVSTYIGAAQVVSLEKMDIVSYEDALSKARTAGDDTTALEKAYEDFKEDDGLTNLMNLRHLTSEYHPATVPDRATMMAVQSPYFGVDDFRWFLKQLGDMEQYWELNNKLFEYTFDFDAYEQSMNYEMPVYFISGSCDWICPVASVKEYYEDISAEEKSLNILDGCEHNLQYSSPKEFSLLIMKILEE